MQAGQTGRHMAGLATNDSKHAFELIEHVTCQIEILRCRQRSTAYHMFVSQRLHLENMIQMGSVPMQDGGQHHVQNLLRGDFCETGLKYISLQTVEVVLKKIGRQIKVKGTDTGGKRLKRQKLGAATGTRTGDL